MTTIPDGPAPLIAAPEKTPAALRHAVRALDLGALSRFEAEWAQATSRARDEYSVMPVLHFTEKWHLWVAVRRWPGLVARLRDCERRAASAASVAEARAASAEIGEILKEAEAGAR